MGYWFLKACITGSKTTNIVNSSWRRFLEVFRRTEGVNAFEDLLKIKYLPFCMKNESFQKLTFNTQ